MSGSTSFSALAPYQAFAEIASNAGTGAIKAQYVRDGIGTAIMGASYLNVKIFGAIGDGNTHTISTAPTNHPLSGVTTLSQLAAKTIGGMTPWSWINTNTIFTGGTGTYALTDAKVPNLDLDWLAIQAAMMVASPYRRAYIPGGLYTTGSSQALPIMIPESLSNGFGGSGNYPGGCGGIQGDGSKSTVITPLLNPGSLTPVISFGDPSGTASNSLGRYAGNGAQYDIDVRDIGIIGIGTAGNWTATPTLGVSPNNNVGIAYGARARLKNITCYWLHTGVDIVGDHAMCMDNALLFGCYYGAYWNSPNTALLGDLMFRNLNSSGCSMAALAAHGSASIAGTFEGETYLSAPYAMFGETGGSNAAVLQDAKFTRLMTEFVGNAAIHDDNVFSGGTYTNGNKVRDISNVQIDRWFHTFVNSHTLTTGGRVSRALVDVRYFNNSRIMGMSANGAVWTPFSPVGLFNCQGFANSWGGVYLEGDIYGIISQCASSSITMLGPSTNTCCAVTFNTWGSQPGSGWGAGTFGVVSGGGAATLNATYYSPGDVYTGVAPEGTTTLGGYVSFYSLEGGSYTAGKAIALMSAAQSKTGNSTVTTTAP